MKFGLNFGLLGSGGGTPPLIQGDYIWYTYDPDDGYLTLDNGTRVVDDKGNTNRAGASGRFDGVMHSGRAISVSGDGNSVDVPINYELGSELVHPDKRWTGNEGVVPTDIPNGSSLEYSGTSTNDQGTRLYSNGNNPSESKQCILEFDADTSGLTSGPFIIDRYYTGSGTAYLDEPYTIVNGHNRVQLGSFVSSAEIVFFYPQITEELFL